MAVQDQRVLFSYVPTGQEMPATPDQNTIYFVEGTKQIYVGSQVIADNYSGAKPSFNIVGSGDCIVSAEYNSGTNTLTLTYGDFPEVVVPEYTITKAGTPDSGYSATYQLYKDSVAVGDKINIPNDMVVSSGSVVNITFNNDKLWDGDVDVTEIIKGAGVTPTAADAGPYVRLIVANKAQDRIYIAVSSLVDVYTTEQGAAEVQLAISNTNEISATLVDGGISGDKIGHETITGDNIEPSTITVGHLDIPTREVTQTASLDGLSLSVSTQNGEVTSISGSIAEHTYDTYGSAVTAESNANTYTREAIADLDATVTQTASLDGLALSVTETDGVLTAVSGSIAANTYDPYGAAAAAVATWTVIS